MLIPISFLLRVSYSNVCMVTEYNLFFIDSGRELIHFPSIEHSNCFLCRRSHYYIRQSAESFLRNFGVCISTMEMCYLNRYGNRAKNTSDWRDIEKTVAKYCGNSLTCFIFSRCTGDLM